MCVVFVVFGGGCSGYWRVSGMAAPSSWKARRWVSVAWARMGTEVGPPSKRSGAASRCGTPRCGHCGANRRRLTGIYAIRPWRGRRNCPQARRFRVRGAGGHLSASPEFALTVDTGGVAANLSGRCRASRRSRRSPTTTCQLSSSEGRVDRPPRLVSRV